MATPEREAERHGPAKGASRHGPDCDCTRCRGLQPGHTLSPATSHGCYSPRLMSPRAREIEDWAFAVAPWLAPSDGPVVTLFALTMARVEAANAALAQVDEMAATDLSAYIGENGLVFDRLRRDTRAWMRQALALASELGLTPAARARLQLDVASTRRALSLVELHERAKAEQAVEGEAAESA